MMRAVASRRVWAGVVERGWTLALRREHAGARAFSKKNKAEAAGDEDGLTSSSLGKWYRDWALSKNRDLSKKEFRPEFAPLLELSSTPEEMVAAFATFAREQPPQAQEYFAVIRSLCDANMVTSAATVARCFRTQFGADVATGDRAATQRSINWEMLVCAARVNDKCFQFWLECVESNGRWLNPLGRTVDLERALRSGELSHAVATATRIRGKLDPTLAEDLVAIIRDRFKTLDDRLQIYCELIWAAKFPHRGLSDAILADCLEQGLDEAIGVVEFMGVRGVAASGPVLEAVVNKLMDKGKAEQALKFALGKELMGKAVHKTMKSWVETGVSPTGRKWEPQLRLAGLLRYLHRNAEEGNAEALIAATESTPLARLYRGCPARLAASKPEAILELLQKLEFTERDMADWKVAIVDVAVTMVRAGKQELAIQMLDTMGTMTKGLREGGGGERRLQWLYSPTLAALVKKEEVLAAQPLYERVRSATSSPILTKGMDLLIEAAKGNREAALDLLADVRSLGGDKALVVLRQTGADLLPAFRFSDFAVPLIELSLRDGDEDNALCLLQEVLPLKYKAYVAARTIVFHFVTKGKIDEAFAVMDDMYAYGRFNPSVAARVCALCLEQGMAEKEYNDVVARLKPYGYSEAPAWTAEKASPQ
mmetsp:Transcript_1993/g.7202  ORF Transcript_1993/g.7202 Transcript_1993/m.7202 type:complete len:653 (+) Transcript_1993:1-1959(+)